MLSTYGWKQYGDHVYGIDSFGTSAPYADVISHFGFKVEDIVNYINKKML
jgi:transketolase